MILSFPNINTLVCQCFPHINVSLILAKVQGADSKGEKNQICKSFSQDTRRVRCRKQQCPDYHDIFLHVCSFLQQDSDKYPYIYENIWRGKSSFNPKEAKTERTVCFVFHNDNDLSLIKDRFQIFPLASSHSKQDLRKR